MVIKNFFTRYCFVTEFFIDYFTTNFIFIFYFVSSVEKCGLKMVIGKMKIQKL